MKILKSKTTAKMGTSEVGLGNQATLAKIDKLRELSIGALIPLSQVSHAICPGIYTHNRLIMK